MDDVRLTEWRQMLTEIRVWRKQHPKHAPQLHRMERNIEDMYFRYLLLIKKNPFNSNPRDLEKAEEIKQEAAVLFKKLSKMEIIASLSK